MLDRLPIEREPTLILCHTVSEGLSFGENQAGYHFWNQQKNCSGRQKKKWRQGLKN
ncbi:MAG: hypothetical protein ACLVJO_04320 [[Clostridium] scindens]